MEEEGPWPGRTVVLSSRFKRRVLIDFISWEPLPPGRSLRPIEPANRVSPENSRLSKWKHTPPGVWPGVRITLPVWFPNVIVSLSLNQLVTLGIFSFAFIPKSAGWLASLSRTGRSSSCSAKGTLSLSIIGLTASV